MSTVAKRYQFHAEPTSNPDATIVVGNARFTVFTSRLVRMEYSPTSEYEDRSSQTFWFRNQPKPEFKLRKKRRGVQIETEALKLTYDGDGPFASANLSVVLKGTGTVWHFGDVDDKNLMGTYRTLDGVDGSVELDPGLVSRSGWCVIDDSKSLVFNHDCWLEPRQSADGQDLYFFGYGDDYTACLKDYVKLSGRIPLIPRWALGNWWSKYWAYSDRDLLSLMEEFRNNDVPLSVCVIDMDWHVVENKHHRGWTGYTWDKKYFPDPAGFLSKIKSGYGVKTSLNLHPHEGVHPHEEAYPDMAKAMGIDPGTKKPIKFDIADPKFTKEYFEVLHHPIENQGIDFWWMDWQQGEKTKIEGLDPLYWLNHLHYYDMCRDGKKRPFIFSRWSEYGNHRYQIGFSGDTMITWSSLAFQPYFTSTASNVAYCWWSHDIGGHIGGLETPELFARWVQYGVFSPILRLHSSKSGFVERRPWMHGREYGYAACEAMRLRHKLIPYIYTMNERCHREAEFLIRPMYHKHPKCEEAYHVPHQYYFGSELIAAPFCSREDPATRHTRQIVWLPRGDWRNFFTGEFMEGGRFHSVYGTIDDIPVFARAGGIVPMARNADWDTISNPSAMDLKLFVGHDGHFSMYEDDGETIKHEKGRFCRTGISQKCMKRKVTVFIKAPTSNLGLLPTKREWSVDLVGVADGGKVTCEIGGKAVKTMVAYESETETLKVDLPRFATSADIQLAYSVSRGTIISRKDRRTDKAYAALGRFHLPVNVKSNASRWYISKAIDDPAILAEYKGEMSDSQLRCLMEILTGCGVEVVEPKKGHRELIAWNPNNVPEFTLSLHNGWAYGNHQHSKTVDSFVVRNVEVPRKGARSGGDPTHFRANYCGVTAVDIRANLMNYDMIVD